MKNQISLCMIVKDEEEYLPACLSSAKDVADEIIIVDTGSTDKTVEIAKSFGAKVYYFEWNNNFSEARNESLKYATKDWILIMDADDELYPEDREAFKVLINSDLKENAIYFFQTLSYGGSSIDDTNTTVNLNPRLFKNGRGIHYEGEIHNQLIPIKNEYNIICDSIKIHHYGYLNKRVISKDKRNRNIAILKEQIKKHPESKFASFNLGNEYAALGDMHKALECYYEAYDGFSPNLGYSSILLIRIISSNYSIGEYSEALKFIDVGINYFPKCTDLYFYKAAIFKINNKPTLQIRNLEKCIEIGEAPPELKFFYGTGSFRAYLELGNVYMLLGDYDTAYNYYIEAMKSKKDFTEPLYNIIHILSMESLSLEEIKERMDKLSNDCSNACYSLADIFYNEGYYKTALEYIERCEQSGIVKEDIMILKAKCLMRIGAFEECINMNSVNENNLEYVHLFMYKVLSSTLTCKPDFAAGVIRNLEKNAVEGANKKFLDVYSQLVRLFNKESTEPLTEVENDRGYMAIVMEICEILLMNNKFDELKIALNLLNLINNKFALLNLGKLYYRYGYIELGKKEILRSIKELEVYDNEGLDMLKG